jgi:hypothetical protein
MLCWISTSSAGQLPHFDVNPPGFPLILPNLAALASNYGEAGINVFGLACFVSNRGELHAIQEAAGPAPAPSSSFDASARD